MAISPIPTSPASSKVPPELLASLRPFGPGGKSALGLLGAMMLLAALAYLYQLRHGLAVTALSNYISWGVYIINFIFFIGISMAGTLISAILRITGAEWRRPITRLAEGITLFALIIAGPMIMIDMGRPDRLNNVFLFGRLQSPILWDVLSLNSYMFGSALYLFLPLIPDMALLRDSEADFSPWRRRLYGLLSLGYRHTPEQHHRLEKTIGVLSTVIILVAVSIHTVTAWIFGMTLRPGWHTTIIGPDFVIGALYSGIAAVIIAMAIFRHFYKLQKHLTLLHFRRLGLLLLVVGMAYFYFTVNNFLGSTYVHEEHEAPLLASLFGGSYARLFWTMITLGLVVPLTLLALPWTRSIGGIVTASVFVNIGMWLMRFVIVVPTLASPFLPLTGGQAISYTPTWVEGAITLGAFSAFIALYMLFAKVFPIISIWEIAETDTTHSPL